MTDPTYEGRAAEEVAAEAIAALDGVRSRSRRLAVVGQITYGPQDATHTVVLGPFGTRGVLDSEEKFRKALEAGSAARTAGQDLAWDPVTRRGRGRFMLAPAFARPRDAWDFHRPPKGDLAAGPWNLGLAEEQLARIRATVNRWAPGLWSEELTASGRGGAVCSCGLTATYACRACGEAVTSHCALHGGENVHQCRRRAA